MGSRGPDFTVRGDTSSYLVNVVTNIVTDMGTNFVINIATNIVTNIRVS